MELVKRFAFQVVALWCEWNVKLGGALRQGEKVFSSGRVCHRLGLDFDWRLLWARLGCNHPFLYCGVWECIRSGQLSFVRRHEKRAMKRWRQTRWPRLSGRDLQRLAVFRPFKCFFLAKTLVASLKSSRICERRRVQISHTDSLTWLQCHIKTQASL